MASPGSAGTAVPLISTLAAARPVAGTYALSSHDPTLIGELIVKTRSR